MSKLPYNLRPGAKKNPDEAKKNVANYNGYWNNIGGSVQSSGTTNSRNKKDSSYGGTGRDSISRKDTSYGGTGRDSIGSGQKQSSGSANQKKTNSIKKEKMGSWDANAEMKRRREEAEAKKKRQGQFASAAQRTQKSLGGSLTNSEKREVTDKAKRNAYKVSQQNNSVGYQNMMKRKNEAQMRKAKEKLYEDQLNPKKKKGK